MREALRAVPGLLWFALVWMALALWAQDVRGAYIAIFCAICGVIQLFRQQPAVRE